MSTPYLNKDGIRKLCLQQLMEKQGVQIKTKTEVKQISQGEVLVETDGEEQKLKADYVIVALERSANNPFGKEISKIVKEVYEIGDCVEARSITEAYDDANYFARII